MGDFLRRGLFFALFLFVYFGINGAINYINLRSFTPSIQKRNIIILGDSHAERGIDPSLFYDAENYALPGEPYYITYWKLQKINQIAQIDTLILSFAPHNLAGKYQHCLEQKDSAEEMIRRSYPLTNVLGKAEQIPLNFKALLKVLWKDLCFFPKNDFNHYLGFFFPKQGNNPIDPQKALDYYYSPVHSNFTYSEANIDYLDSIAAYSQKHHIRLILVNTPQHQAYTSKLPPPIKTRYSSIANDFKTQGIELINGDYFNYPDSLFKDVDHLNWQGANQFTRDLVAKMY